MNASIDWKTLFVIADGRLARTPFLIAIAILFAIVIFYEAVAGATMHWITGWIVYPIALYCGTCVLSKRLHDRGRSGWYAATILFALIGVWTSFNSVIDAFFLAILVWGVVELGVLTGEPGANRFGSSPLRAA